MSTIRIQGLQSLKGEIKIQGSKNAVLPMMAASVLHKGYTTLMNVPLIQDVFCMMGILDYLGCRCELDGHRLTIDAREIVSAEIPDEQVKQMRSSIMLLGPLLGRCGEAKTYSPGGCSIGERPIDLHLYALSSLGAKITEDDDRIEAGCERLTGGAIRLDFPSVGATENALLGAVLADGETRIYGAAKEPEIEELCLFLVSMGGQITGIGSSELTVLGVSQLRDTSYRVCGDRIVTGTYLAAVMAVAGDVVLHDAPISHMDAVLALAEAMGAEIETLPDGLRVNCRKRMQAKNIQTGPYPEFPTDLQSLMLSVLAVGEGRATICETVFEGRFETVSELQKLGAQIVINGDQAAVTGVYPLTSGSVAAKDLRGGAALVVAGLAATGITEIRDCHHICRGYEDICGDLSRLGAWIEYQS